MQFRVITIRPKSPVATVAVGTAIVVAGVALLAVGTALLVGVAAVGATAGVATLVYRRLTGRGSPDVDRVRQSTDSAVRGARLGLDPRLEIQPPPPSSTTDHRLPPDGQAS
jgi:hypothetical protein